MSKNPFNFQHLDLNKTNIYCDGELVPGQIFTPDYENSRFMRVYTSTMNVLDYFNIYDSNSNSTDWQLNISKMITICMPFTPDAQCNAYRIINYSWSLPLEVNFASALTNTINALLFAIFESKLEINSLRDVILSRNC